MSDLISLIIPIYNASEYLKQCIESIQAQTYKNLEILLIDDGSTDDSIWICKKYQKVDKRIKIIEQDNGGSVVARKAGLEKANGKYIGFVDADDYIDSDMFEKLHRKITETSVDFVQSGMILDDKKICDYQEGVIDFTKQEKTVYINENIFKKQNVSFNLWSKLFKADLIINAYMNLPDEQSYGEDMLCLCKYIFKCNRFYLYNNAFYHYRIRERSLCHLNWLDLCIEEAKLYSHVVRILKRNGALEQCGDSARYHYRKKVMWAMMSDSSNGIRVSRFKFPDIDILKGKKIALYGAGKVGKDFYFQFSRESQCEIIAWADKEKYGVKNLISICHPMDLKDIKYDVIVVAVKNKKIIDEIKEELIQNRICEDSSQILWKEPVCLW